MGTPFMRIFFATHCTSLWGGKGNRSKGAVKPVAEPAYAGRSANAAATSRSRPDVKAGKGKAQVTFLQAGIA